jgi:hypothetical protein
VERATSVHILPGRVINALFPSDAQPGSDRFVRRISTDKWDEPVLRIVETEKFRRHASRRHQVEDSTANSWNHEAQ